MSTPLGDSRLNENSKWTPEEDAVLVEAVSACESFRRAFTESGFTQARSSRFEAMLEYYRSVPSREDQQVLQETLDPFSRSIPP